MGSLELAGTAGVGTRVLPCKDFFLRISKTRERWLVCVLTRHFWMHLKNLDSMSKSGKRHAE